MRYLIIFFFLILVLIVVSSRAGSRQVSETYMDMPNQEKSIHIETVYPYNLELLLTDARDEYYEETCENNID
jgi:hypothetical protein